MVDSDKVNKLTCVLGHGDHDGDLVETGFDASVEKFVCQLSGTSTISG